MSNMIFELSSGATVQVLKIGDRFQVAEVFDYKPAKLVGGLHGDISSVLDEIWEFDLTHKERNTLMEIKDSLVSINKKITEYFAMHSEYLAELEKNR